MRTRVAIAVAVLVVSLVGAGALFAAIAQPRLTPTAVDFTSLVDAESYTLTVATPGGSVWRRSFAAGEAISFSVAGFGDGNYQWELTAAPRLKPEERARLAAARASGDPTAFADAQRAAGISPDGLVQSGGFRVADGAVVDDAKRESPGDLRNIASPMKNITAPDFVIADDLIVQGSTCTGLDCINNESFGFDTLRLRENNLRIHFDDTSTSAGFPANDWRIIVNDSASGGSSKFSIDDSTGAKTPFTITAGAATNSIFVDSTGRVGLRTSTPVLDLHVNTSNTPAIRLEQNNTGGFTAQTWDVAGNEANFFVRDVTGGSRLPLRIRPGAPTSSIDINASGNVGIGTASPARSLDITREGAVDIGLLNTSGTDSRWFLQNDNDVQKTFKISREGGGGPVVTINSRLDVNGVTFKVDGSVQATNVVFSSSRSLKEDFQPLSNEEVLAKLATLPVSEWRFKDGPHDVRHIGPMAEDFQAAFGLSSDASTISVTDTSGVALAAIQGLLTRLDALSRQNAELQKRVESLEEALAASQP